MTKEDFLTLKADIKSFKRIHQIVKELILNFPQDAHELNHEEEFLHLCLVRIWLEKTIIRMQRLKEKVSRP